MPDEKSTGSEKKILVRAQKGEPLFLYRVQGPAPITVASDPDGDGLGWPVGDAFEPDEALYGELRAAYDLGDHGRVGELWRKARPALRPT